MFTTTVDTITTKEGKSYSHLCGRSPKTSGRKKYMYVIYVYDCNSILTTETKNRSDKEMIRSLTELNEDFKSCGIKPGLHFMDNKASIDLKNTMNSMKIKYQLVLPINHRAKNTDRESDKNLQKPFHSGTVHCRQIISSSTVGNIITAGKNQPKFAQTIKNSSSPISLSSHIWRILLQTHTVIPTWDTSSDS